jgi:hypothetical protein
LQAIIRNVSPKGWAGLGIDADAPFRTSASRPDAACHPCPLTARSGSHPAQMSTDIALVAADLTLLRKLALADAVIYASARKYNVELVTSDDHFEGLPGVTYFSKKDA